MTLGLGMLNKTSGFLSLYLAPFLLILFDSQASGDGGGLSLGELSSGCGNYFPGTL
jgi:hypothetical protein